MGVPCRAILLRYFCANVIDVGVPLHIPSLSEFFAIYGDSFSHHCGLDVLGRSAYHLQLDWWRIHRFGQRDALVEVKKSINTAKIHIFLYKTIHIPSFRDIIIEATTYGLYLFNN